MELLTKEILSEVHPLYADKGGSDPLIVAKYFDPIGSYTFYMLEYDPEERIAFGYATGLQYDEYGSVSLAEWEDLAKAEGRMGLGIERDIHFPINEHRISDVQEGRVQ
jgi:hypothetical protein